MDLKMPTGGVLTICLFCAALPFVIHVIMIVRCIADLLNS